MTGEEPGDNEAASLSLFENLKFMVNGEAYTHTLSQRVVVCAVLALLQWALQEAERDVPEDRRQKLWDWAIQGLERGARMKGTAHGPAQEPE